MDTWQYFIHRYMHINKFLYKHIHSKHHTLVVPYAFGALYNHPLEGLLLDTVGGALSFLVSGMTPRTGIYFFSFATVKTVDDHCGLWLPGNVLHLFFQNNSAYHDIHHQLYGNKYNFSQPFFVMWDKILGTYMPYTLETRKEGGLEARPVKKDWRFLLFLSGKVKFFWLFFPDLVYYWDFDQWTNNSVLCAYELMGPYYQVVRDPLINEKLYTWDFIEEFFGIMI